MFIQHSGQSKYRPPDHRNLALLAYLAETVSHLPAVVASLQAALPQCVAWRDVGLHVCQAPVPNSQVLYALNGSVVALCSVPPDKVCIN